MTYERIYPYEVSIEDVLTEILEYMEDRQDADYDGERFVANKEMNFASDIRQALWQIENVKGKLHMAELALNKTKL